MEQNFWGFLKRRDFFSSGLVAVLLGRFAQTNQAQAADTLANNLYRALGVRPVINARGTFTIISGSQSLPPVKKAMDEASRHYIHLDELMEAAGKRLAELTGAEWGLVTAGCAAGMTSVTAACIAGTNPERMQRLPDLTGMRDQVVIPAYSRNVYDHAIRMLGVKIVEVNEPAQLEAAFTDRTAMAYIMAGPGDDGPLGTAAVAAVAKRKNVPLLVDAAAEGLTFPNLHLQRGATIVAYSGGKCIRGPQCAGVLLGEKSLLQAAWLNSAPHHAFGRSLKVGKEEIMGMLAAVEAWKERDHEKEYRQWESWLETIAAAVKKVPGVTTEVIQPKELSNRTPSLRIRWQGEQLGITGTELSRHLLDSDPRIVVAGATGTRPDRMESSLTVTPWMMMPEDHVVVAQRIAQGLTKPPKIDSATPPSGSPATIAGQWDVDVIFTRGTSQHWLSFEQPESGTLIGTHRGEMLSGDLSGAVSGNSVRFRSSHKYEGTRLGYEFQGQVTASGMEGTVNLGEYGEARWIARRHQYKAPGGIVRPVKSPV